MVLKRRLPSTVSEEKKDGNLSPSTKTPEMQAPPAMSENKPASAPMNPFEAQQQTHVRKDAPKTESHSAVNDSTKPKVPDFSAQKDPFSAPIAPQAETPAPSSVIPEKEGVSKNPPKESEVAAKDIPEFDDPFASPFTTSSQAALDTWAEEPTEANKTEKPVEAVAKPAAAEKQNTVPKRPQESQTEQPRTSTPVNQNTVKPEPQKSAVENKAAPVLKMNTQNAELKTVGLGVVAVGLVAVLGYTLFFDKKDDTAEVVSRWTGALQEVSEELPEQEGFTENTGKAESVLEPEAIITTETEIPSEEEFLAEEEAFSVEGSEEPLDLAQESDSAETQNNENTGDVVVEFVDVSEEDVDAPIVADENQEMPEDIGVIAKMQNAIVKAREERDGRAESVAGKEDKPVPAGEVHGTADELSRQLEEELAEYRRILSGSTPSGEILSPEEFFGGAEPNNLVDNPLADDGSIPLPKPERAGNTLSDGEANARYGSNPYNLPVVPEPGQQKQTIRTLSDFDSAVFDAPHQRVRMPKNVKPSLRTTAFPPVTLLSIIPNRGVIAEANRRQGVLMIGETIDGWELISVYQEYAEFKRGEKTHMLTLK